MADLEGKTLEEAEKFLQVFMSALVGQIHNLSTFTVNAIIEMYMKKEDWHALLEQGGEVTLKEFKKALSKGETFSSLRVPDEMVKDYKRFFDNKNVLYVSMDDLENGTKVFMFRDRDLQKVQEAKKLVDYLFLGETEIPPQEFLDAYENRNISILANLTAEEVELFRYYMKDEPILFSVISDSDGVYSILHDKKDSEKVDSALHQSNWALQGNLGERVKEQVQYRMKGREQIAQALEDAEAEFYIVSKNNPKNFVHIHERQISYYKNEQEIATVLSDDKDFKTKAWNMVDGISAATIFTAPEFYTNLAIRQNLVEQKPTLDEFPSEMIVQEERRKYNRLRDLASIKMGMDNENQGDWALYVDSVPFSEYSGREEMLDDNEVNARQKEFEKMVQCAKTTQHVHVRDEIKVEESSLDVIIRQAEEKVSHIRENTSKERSTSREETADR